MIKKFLDIVDFLKRPKTGPSYNGSLHKKIRMLFDILMIDVLVSFSIAVIIVVFSLFLPNDIFNRAFIFAADSDVLMIFMKGILIAPVLEEISFRGALKISKLNITLAIPFLVYFILLYFDYIDINDFFSLLNAKVFSGILILTSIFLFVPEKFFNELAEKISFPALFYFSATVFAFCHLNDLSSVNMATAIIVIPLMILPYLWSGLILGYSRIKLGLTFSIAHHSMLNLFLLSLSFLLKSLT